MTRNFSLTALFTLLTAVLINCSVGHITADDTDTTSFIFRPLYPHALHRQFIPPSNPPAECDNVAQQVLMAEREVDRLVRQRLAARRRVDVLIKRRERSRRRLTRLRDQLGALAQQRLDGVDTVRELKVRLRNGDESVRGRLRGAERRLEQIASKVDEQREKVRLALVDANEAATAVTGGWRVVLTIVQALRMARTGLREARQLASECGLAR